MKKIKFNPDLICPFCADNTVEHNGEKYISREHVPPLCIFTGHNDDLITIPSCKECNNGTSKYDIELKFALGIHLGRTSQEFWQSTRESLKKDKPSRKKRQKEIIQSIPDEITDNGFGVVGHKIPFKSKPVNIVISKICKGLHWYVSNQLLPKNCKIDINFIHRGQKLDKNISQLFDKFGQILSTGNATFKATYALPIDEINASIWLLEFYGQPCFLVTIRPDQ